MASYKQTVRKYKDFFLPVGIILVVVFSFLFVLVPVFQATLALYEEVQAMRILSDTLARKRSVLDSQDEALLDEQLKTVSSYVPIDKSLPSILQTIETVGSDANVTVSSISLANPGSLATQAAETASGTAPQLDPAVGAYALPFSTTILGDYENLVQFLAHTIDVRRILRVNSFALKLGVDSSLDTSIQGDTLFAPLLTQGQQEILEPISPQEESVIAKIRSLKDAGLLKQFDAANVAVSGPQKENPFSL